MSLFTNKWPNYCQEYNILSNIIEFAKVEPKLGNINAYTLDDEQAKKLGLFLIVDRYQLFVGCLGQSLELLEQALHQLDWSRGVLCTSMPQRYLATVLKVIRAKQLDVEFHHESDLYLLSKERALQLNIDCPEGFQLEPLSEEDAQLIDQEWPYSHEGSLYFLQRQIRLCPSMGLYDKQTRKLIAWCIRTQDSLLAALHVDSKYKRRGFGTTVVKAISRRIAALGDDVAAEIYSNNKASCSLFLKLGFQVIDQCHWINTAPTIGKFTWPEGQQDPKIKNVKIYTLSEQRAKDEALFVIVDRYQLFVGCLSNSEALVKEALTLIDWSSGLKCSSIPARHIKDLEIVVKEKQLKLQFNDVTNLYYMTRQEASELKVEAPAGYFLDTLKEVDADLVNEEWPNRHVGSLYFIQRQIRMCPSVGLYTTDAKELVAWCIRLQGGYLGALQVRSSHKRRGFGSVVTREITRRIGSLGQDVMALVNPQNNASCAMFDKLGFKVIDQCYWLRTEPLTGEVTWPDGE
ncbi:hypothetical protein ACLKA7_003563 [Drosophila subpalustris]